MSQLAPAEFTFDRPMLRADIETSRIEPAPSIAAWNVDIDCGVCGVGMDIARIIDDIYEAAIAPELWPHSLDRLTQLADAEGTILFATPTETGRAISSQPQTRDFASLLASEWLTQNERLRRLSAIKEPRFLTDLDAFTLEELAQVPFYRDVLWPLGLGWCATTIINLPTGNTLVFSIERARVKGPVGKPVLWALDRLRPHLARASVLSARAGLSRAKSGVVALESLGLPAAILSDKGKILAENALFGETPGGLSIGPGDILKFKDRVTQTRFTTLIADGTAGGEKSAPGSFILRADQDANPHIAHLFPIGGVARDVFTGASALLYITPLAGQATMPAELLQGMFDLTPSEANVAKLIGDGRTIADASKLLMIQESTVRVHLKAIFFKTGVRRQSELVRLIMMPSIRASS